VRKLFLSALAAVTVAAFSSPGFALEPYDVPTLSCPGDNPLGAAIDLEICAGATGAPAGVSIHWRTLEDYEADILSGGNGWGGEICALSLSGQPSMNHPDKSRWDLVDPFQCETIRIGDINFDETGVSGNECAMEPLQCGTTYVFRVFAHAGRGMGKSDFSGPTECSTADCAQPGDACTYTQGFWKNHGPAEQDPPAQQGQNGCQSGNNTNEWPQSVQNGGMVLGSVPYSQEQLCAILNQNVGGGQQANALVSLAHQLIAAQLNVTNNSETVCADVQNFLDAANAVIGALVVPPVGGGYLPPGEDMSDLIFGLDTFNNGGSCGWGHCGDDPDPCEGGPAQTDWNLGQAPDPSTYPAGQNWEIGTMRVDASGGIPNPWCGTVGGAGELCREGGQWPNGDALNCQREYILDLDLGFDNYYAMMAYDLGVAKRGFRLYTSIDHWNGSYNQFVNNAYITQDVMEYSVWGYVGPVDGSGVATAADLMTLGNWKLLSDVVAHSTPAVPELPTYTFDGADGAAAAAPVTVWIGGSAQCGQGGPSPVYGHGFTRDYVFCDAYRYVGVRSSTISISITDGPGDQQDGDPELDAVFGFDPDGGGTAFARLEQQPVDGSIRPQLRQGRVTVYGLTPNPFSQATRLDFVISGSAAAPVKIDVFNVSGRLVRTLETGVMAPGQHSVTWNGRDAGGAQVGPGVYFIRANVGGESATSRVLRLR